ncbi:hypothetical protein CBA19CS22_34560 [Caballeronia novacaledonica]|uniref:Uncharacterized protein n=1 Tax=Caballeronia novacaledonica TaxID=1544861 RepID=A0ACB5R3M2_9BURK|nr:hypothetical protein CBA19CS22_34560 [Caballeronia novacaledonica]
MRIAPSRYRRNAAQLRDPSLLCARAKRDALLRPEIKRVWQRNMQVYGADKVWKQMNREGISVARCAVERQMKQQGLRGVSRGKRIRTTIPDVSPRGHWTGSTVSSRLIGRTSSGFLISRTFGRGRDGSMWRS